MLRKQKQGGLLACGLTTLLLSGQFAHHDVDIAVKAKAATNSVCLIHAVYEIVLADGTTWGAHGIPLSIEYTGSGFLVSENGHIASCRHVLQPWTESVEQMALIAEGATPVFTTLTATFPGQLPINLDQNTIKAGDLDVALVRGNPELMTNIPVLQLRRNGSEGSGAHAAVIGYPLGVMPLVVRAPKEVADKARTFFDQGKLIFYLASQGAVSPLFFKGVINSDQDHMITTDAAMTFGCSGGPVIGDDGKVIGVSFAILQNFGGANMVVPVSHLLALLD